MYEEYGGYIEFETYFGTEYHSEAIALNCGRNCLAYLIESHNINNIYLPYFMCSSVENICKKYEVEIIKYSIDKDFLPVLDFEITENDWIYIANYYGQLSNDTIVKIKDKFKNVIIDNTESFFQEAVKNVDTIYSCRKYFGVPDGAYLYTNKRNLILDQDISYNRMLHLLGRYEKTASEFYEESKRNNQLFKNEEIKYMSKLTQNLLRGINYGTIECKRTQNFEYLYRELSSINMLNLKIPKGPFMYPLLIENGSNVRKKLQEMKIYIPILWPDVLKCCEEKSIEYKYARDILPIPVDQRYCVDDMEYIVKAVKRCIG